jgi:hypothetical protein
MPFDLRDSTERTKHWAPTTAMVQTEALVKARVLVDQVRLSRLATQNAIERSRVSIAETSAALVAIRRALGGSLRDNVQRRISALKPTRQDARGARLASRTKEQQPH